MKHITLLEVLLHNGIDGYYLILNFKWNISRFWNPANYSNELTVPSGFLDPLPPSLSIVCQLHNWVSYKINLIIISVAIGSFLISNMCFNFTTISRYSPALRWRRKRNNLTNEFYWKLNCNTMFFCKCKLLHL